MTDPIVEFKYPYNPEGNLPDCIIKDEAATLTKGNVNYSFIVPRQSPFFKKDLKVFSVIENRELKIDLDYVLTHSFHSASNHLRKEIYGSITIIDQEIHGTILLTYSTLGGDYTYRDAETLMALTGILTGQRTVNWEDVVDVPDVFPPLEHQHIADDLKDMDDVVDAIDRITEVLSGETHPNHRHTMDKIDGLLEALEKTISSDKNVAYTPIDPISIIDYAKVIALTMPLPSMSVNFMTDIWISDGGESSRLLVFGSIKNNMAHGDDWESISVYSNSNSFTGRISGTYAQNGQPVLYIESKVSEWPNVEVSVVKTIYSDYKEDFLSGAYSFASGTTLLGKIVNIETIAYLSDLGPIDGDIEDIRNEIEELTKRVSKNETDISALDVRVGDNEDSIVKNAGNIDDNKDDIDKNVEAINKLKEDLETEVGDLDSIKVNRSGDIITGKLDIDQYLTHNTKIMPDEEFDFNDFQTSQYLNIVAASRGENGPPISHCILIVIGSNVANYSLQIAVQRTEMKMFMRTFHRINESWSEWVKIYNENERPTKAEVGLGNVDNIKQLPIHSVIKEGIDLNDITDDGLYEQNRNASILPDMNYPVEKSGKMLVLTVNPDNQQIVQIYHTIYGELYTRSFYQNWTKWSHIYGTEHKPTKADVGLGNVDNLKQVPIVGNSRIHAVTSFTIDGNPENEEGERGVFRIVPSASTDYGTNGTVFLQSGPSGASNVSANGSMVLSGYYGASLTELLFSLLTKDSATVTVSGSNTRYKLYHEANKPTKADVGLGNVDDVKQVPITRILATTGPLQGGGDLTEDRTLAIQSATTEREGVTKLNDNVDSTSTTEAATPNAVKKAFDKASDTAEIEAHIADKGNPHDTTKVHVDLGNVDNVKQLPFTGGTLVHRSSYFDIYRYNEGSHGDPDFEGGYLRSYVTFTRLENSAVWHFDVRSDELSEDTPNRQIQISLNGSYLYHDRRKPTADDVGARPSDWVPTWSDVTSKPLQATRWPTYGEVTDKPTTFPPATHNHKWSDITDPPSTMPPSKHEHPWGEVTDKPLQATRWPTYGEVTDKPSTYPPATHDHKWSDITDPPSTMPPSKHEHPWGEVTGKPTTFPPATHSHAWNDITSKPTTFPPATHEHSEYELDDDRTRKITLSTDDPSGGKDGDVWFVVTPTYGTEIEMWVEIGMLDNGRLGYDLEQNGGAINPDTINGLKVVRFSSISSNELRETYILIENGGGLIKKIELKRDNGSTYVSGSNVNGLFTFSGGIFNSGDIDDSVLVFITLTL